MGAGHTFARIYAVCMWMSPAELLISLVAPHHCMGCGTEGAICCVGCAETWLLPLPSRCYRCRSLSREFATCRPCHSRLRRVWVATEYAGLAKKMVHKYKFERARTAARTIAQQMDAVLPNIPQSTVVTYVPTETRRMRMRGYDHAALIARELARERGLPYRRLASRVTHTRQVGAGRAVRYRQLAGAFLVIRDVPPDVLLVDDVVTTGATLETVAAVLRQAGAKHVDAVVFAQKL